MSQGQVALGNTPVAELYAAELAAGELEVPLLPDVAAEVLSSTLDDKGNAARLAELIQQDQALAAHLLRVVNAPAFRGSVQIVALQQAIARLGMERIREIALTISLKSTLLAPGPHGKLIVEAWNHCLRTGLWAKEVARAARKNVELAYLCGLLHNVGTALVVNRMSALERTLDVDDMLDLVDEFSRPTGCMLVERWHLPEIVATVIEFHGRFDEATSEKDLVAVIDTASFISLSQADDELEIESLLSCPALQHLNFYPDDAEKLIEHAEQISATVEGIG